MTYSTPHPAQPLRRPLPTDRSERSYRPSPAAVACARRCRPACAVVAARRSQRRRARSAAAATAPSPCTRSETTTREASASNNCMRECWRSEGGNVTIVQAAVTRTCYSYRRAPAATTIRTCCSCALRWRSLLSSCLISPCSRSFSSFSSVTSLHSFRSSMSLLQRHAG